MMSGGGGDEVGDDDSADEQEATFTFEVWTSKTADEQVNEWTKWWGRKYVWGKNEKKAQFKSITLALHWRGKSFLLLLYLPFLLRNSGDYHDECALMLEARKY